MAEQPDREPELIQGRDALGAKIAEVIGAAESQVALLSLQLARRVYARDDVLDAVKQFVLRSDRCHLRVLVADARSATSGGNTFLDFARRLPSRVQLRELTPEKRETDGPEIVIADARRMVELPSQERLEAVHYPRATSRVSEKIKEFDALWNDSEPVLELRGFQM